jgi:hypothetical protein
MTDQQLLHFNGVNGDRGSYDLPPMSGEELFAFIRGEAPAENLDELRDRYEKQHQVHLGVKEGVDPKKLAEAGWGVIFAHDADPAIKEALSELIEHRRNEANKDHQYFRIYEGPDGHRPGESKSNFLARHGVGPGPADPEKVPYYLMIVGDPERIPNRFQSQLDVQYAVGRIYFETLDEYARYARSVVEAETSQVKLARDISLFSVANENDPSTKLSTEKLMKPLLQSLKDQHEGDGWNISDYFVDTAKKDQLTRLLGGDQTPALLFTASHGMQFDLDSDRQLAHQGALLCQDWPGPEQHSGPIPQGYYFAGDDLSSDASLLGLIAFFYACFGAGTPHYDEFAREAFSDSRKELAPRNFLAKLPLKMLGHPRGGALAVIGHVDRAWSYSFDWPGAGAQTSVFESAVRRLLEGHPVGSAVEYFNERYAELSTVLSDELEEIDFGKKADPYELSGMWTANNDARGYAVIGDPAVRMPVAEEGQDSADRPVIEVQSLAAGPAADAPSALAAIIDGDVEDQAVGHSITITTYEEDTLAGKKVAAETTITIGTEVVVSEAVAAADDALRDAHREVVRRAEAACRAFLDSSHSADNHGNQ